MQGVIEIAVFYRGPPENLLTMEVRDTGVGIEADEIPKLFTRFGKLMRTAQYNHEGIGLGLNIVKSIVESHGGEINVHSDGPGFGSTFSVVLNIDLVGPLPSIACHTNARLISQNHQRPEPEQERRSPQREEESKEVPISEAVLGGIFNDDASGSLESSQDLS
mmetsp:Transcript_17063/g.22988  ORF Transcript_17063/g.22988 Transcript_17063/m.22988 type:complete len:163 (-) Transcript_17063:797-1285(-)